MTESKSSPCRVLIANQAGESCILFAAQLREAGYEPITVSEGTAALQTIQQGLADVAVLDLLLPGLNALEILPAARRVAGNVPIIVTGLQSVEAVGDIVQWHGATGYLELPASKEALIGAIETARRQSVQSGPTPAGGIGAAPPPPTEAVRPGPPAEAASPSGGGRTILLVEDNDRVRRLIGEVLTGAGYAVLEARAGDEALRLCEGRRDPHDLLVADVLLPRITGPQLFQQLAPRWPAMRVLYLSGLAAAEVVSRGWVEEGAPLLEKPFTTAALLAKVHAVMAGRP